MSTPVPSYPVAGIGLKLVQKGFTTFSGTLGGVPFYNGISLISLTTTERSAIAAVYQSDDYDFVATTDIGAHDVTNNKVSAVDKVTEVNLGTHLTAIGKAAPSKH